jgi:hypothetical protein
MGIWAKVIHRIFHRFCGFLFAVARAKIPLYENI